MKFLRSLPSLAITSLLLLTMLSAQAASSEARVKKLIDNDPDYKAWAAQYQPKGQGNDLVNYKQVENGVNIEGAEVMRVWLEFKPGTEKDHAPQYRYILKPVKNVTAEHILSRNKGLYFDQHPEFPAAPWAHYPMVPRYDFPAPVPEKVTDGAIVTDWQYCAYCFNASHNYDWVTVEKIARMKERREENISNALNIEQIKFGSEEDFRQATYQLYKTNGSDLTLQELEKKWGSFDFGLFTGKEAEKQNKLFNRRVAAVETGGKEYQVFLDTAYYPLTFEAWADSKGCPDEVIGISTDRAQRIGLPLNPNEIISNNTDYIDCRSKALASFDIDAYAKAYPALDNQEEKLLDKAGFSMDLDARKKAKKVLTPQKMIADAIAGLEEAEDKLDVAFNAAEEERKFQAKRRAEEQQRKAEHEAWSRAHWANTMNSISQRSQWVANNLDSTNRMIEKTIAMNKPSHGTEYRRENIRRTAEKARSKAEQATSRAKETSENRLSDSANSSPVELPADPEQESQARPNQLVIEAEPVKGANETYLPEETAIDIARTNLENNAAKLCGSSFKAEIQWGDMKCEQSESNDHYMCHANSLVSCWEQRCDADFCGTRH